MNDKIIEMCHKKSRELQVPFNIVLIYYFLESILSLVANSKYKENFVFKGGLLLSNIVGIDSRTTKDIDFLVDKISLDKETIVNVFLDILNQSKEIKFTIKSCDEIKSNDEYKGYRLKIEAAINNISQPLSIDVATADVITPDKVNYGYRSSFGNEINIYSYPLETYLAEKLETIYAKGMFNSRMKDFYDIFILKLEMNNHIRVDILRRALNATFENRGSQFSVEEMLDLLQDIKNDDTMISYWNKYANANLFLNDIPFSMIIDTCMQLLYNIK